MMGWDRSRTFSDIRGILGEWIQECLSTERGRRDAQSALASGLSFIFILYVASQGMIPSYLLIDRSGHAMAIHFTAAEDKLAADLGVTRIQGSTKAAERPAAPRKIESLSSMASWRPDYFGKQALVPAVEKDRPAQDSAPARWLEQPPSPGTQDRAAQGAGAARVDMPVPKFGSASGAAAAVAELSFDVPLAGGARDADFISLSGRTRASSVGEPGGTEMSSHRPILSRPMPTIPEWFERKGLDSFVTVRIVISSSGKVEMAEVEKTSGSKEIDAEARATVLQWVFQSTGYREIMVVKLNYRLR